MDAKEEGTVSKSAGKLKSERETIILTVSIKILQKYEPIAKAQFKKILKLYEQKRRKEASAASKETQDAELRAKNLEDAKQITISEDTSLPAATRIKIKDAPQHKDKRVKLYGWVHRLRRQGEPVQFSVLI